MSTGRFITLEGGEGAGKTTQQTALAEWLRQTGLIVQETREPGGTDGAERIRALLVDGDAGRWDAMTETLLLTAARRDHVERVIRPALMRGEWVVCDRFADSTRAYQGFGLGVAPQIIADLHRTALGDFAPDLTLILDLPVEAGLARAASRQGGAERYERMGRDFHQRLRAGYLDIAAAEPERCRVIDAARPAQQVTESILAAVSAHFALGPVSR